MGDPIEKVAKHINLNLSTHTQKKATIPQEHNPKKATDHALTPSSCPKSHPPKLVQHLRPPHHTKPNKQPTHLPTIPKPTNRQQNPQPKHHHYGTSKKP